jgi:hypothetical protein
MSKEKQPMQEGLFGAAKKFTDAFFDGLKSNAINKALEQAKQNKFPPDVIDSMERIENERQRLSQIIKKYS